MPGKARAVLQNLGIRLARKTSGSAGLAAAACNFPTLRENGFSLAASMLDAHVL